MALEKYPLNKLHSNGSCLITIGPMMTKILLILNTKMWLMQTSKVTLSFQAATLLTYINSIVIKNP